MATKNYNDSLIDEIRQELLVCGFVPNIKNNTCLVYRKEYSVTSKSRYPLAYLMTIVIDMRELNNKVIRYSAYVNDASKYMDDFDLWVFEELADLKKIFSKHSIDVMNDVW